MISVEGGGGGGMRSPIALSPKRIKNKEKEKFSRKRERASGHGREESGASEREEPSHASMRFDDPAAAAVRTATLKMDGRMPLLRHSPNSPSSATHFAGLAFKKYFLLSNDKPR